MCRILGFVSRPIRLIVSEVKMIVITPRSLVQFIDNSCVPFSSAGTAMLVVHGFVDPCRYILSPSDCFLSVCCR